MVDYTYWDVAAGHSHVLDPLEGEFRLTAGDSSVSSRPQLAVPCALRFAACWWDDLRLCIRGQLKHKLPFSSIPVRQWLHDLGHVIGVISTGIEGRSCVIAHIDGARDVRRPGNGIADSQGIFPARQRTGNDMPITA